MMHPRFHACEGPLLAIATLLLSGCATTSPEVQQPRELPAFPGAIGYGSSTPGGRGGQVIAVTTLADSGPGSLREAVTTPGPRNVIFRVAGEIKLKSHLLVTEPFVTIAGQTAPGSGITLRDAGFYIQTHDVVVRFMRSRVGDSLVEEFDTQDALQISGDDTYNVVIDHCSFSWSIDECVGIRVPVHDVTFSWNIISEPLRRPFTEAQIGKERSHSMALILSGGPTRTSLHHNLLANANSRNPRIQGGRHAFINNVVYDWGWLTGTFSRNPEVNFVGNYYKRGPASMHIKAICEEENEMGRVYVQANRSHERSNDEMAQWDPIVAAKADLHQANEPFPMPPMEITSAELAYVEVLRKAGAVAPMRDAIDQRIVRQVRREMGVKIDLPEEVGGYAAVIEGETLPDHDGDGMPDSWEIAQGFDPDDPDDGRVDSDYDGYTNLEEYLEFLVTEATRSRPDVFTIVYDSDEDAPVQVESGHVKLGVATADKSDTMLYTMAYAQESFPMSITCAGGAWSTTRDVRLLPKRSMFQFGTTGEKAHYVVEENDPHVLQFGRGDEARHLINFFDPFPGETAYYPNDTDTLDSRELGVVEGIDVTESLQKALDQCAADPNRVRLFIDNGEFTLKGPVYVPSGVDLHMCRGSRLVFSDGGSDRGMIVFEDVENASLSGFGTLDGNAASVLQRSPLVRVKNARNIHVERVALRDTSGRAVVVDRSNGVTLDRVKILCPPTAGNGGGISIESSRNVTCTRTFISASGDGVIIDADGAEEQYPTNNIAIRETLILAAGAGVRIGPKVRSAISDVLVRDVDILTAGRGLDITQVGSGGVRNVVFRDMTMEIHAQNGDELSGRPFIVRNKPAVRPAPISEILFDRVETNAQRSSMVTGDPSARLEGINFWGCVVLAESKDFPLFAVDCVDGVEFRFLYHNRDKVSGDPIKQLAWMGEQTTGVRAPPEEILIYQDDELPW